MFNYWKSWRFSLLISYFFLIITISSFLAISSFYFLLVYILPCYMLYHALFFSEKSIYYRFHYYRIFFFLYYLKKVLKKRLHIDTKNVNLNSLFCPTHFYFVHSYVNIFLFLRNKKKQKHKICYALMLCFIMSSNLFMFFISICFDKRYMSNILIMLSKIFYTVWYFTMIFF